MKKIYLLVGVPGSGKTWVCNQLKEKFEHLPHDDYIDRTTDHYAKDAIRLLHMTEKHVLIETPFSVSQIMNPIEKSGFPIEAVFIIESPEVTSARYQDRENKEIPKGHLTRIATYTQRAKDLNAFAGTSTEVLNHLLSV